MKNTKIVDVQDLTADFHTIDGVLKVLERVNVVINQGEVVGMVGETGCGKTVTAKILLGILPIPPGKIINGRVFFLGYDVLKMDKRERQALKQEVAYIPQDPMASLNPVFRVGDLMVDMIIWKASHMRLRSYLWKRRRRLLRISAEDYAAELLDKVHIAGPRRILSKYAVELSGGMRQRVLLAMSMIGNPKLLVADEPTTALDATIQKRYLYLVKEAVENQGLSGLYITHNLGVARIICNRTYVMYAGHIVESGNTAEMLDMPLHPYTQGLVSSIPKLTGGPFKGIAGSIPDYLNPPEGCRFHPRCSQRQDICFREIPRQINVGNNHSVACWLYSKDIS